MNVIGAVAGVSAFLSIWFGHVAVRKIEATSPALWPPIVLFVACGLGLEWLSLRTSVALSTACGIAGITLLWDGLELLRQQARVRRGHAPANPRNPRHARMLADPQARATTSNLLQPELAGSP